MLHVRFQETRGALVATPLARTLDAGVAAELRDVIGASASGRALVVVSLAHVRAVDASALAALVSIQKRLAPGGELRLVGVAPRVRALLAVTHLDEVFPTFEDTSGALPG
jgi:anti-anti-sigma factor